MNKTCIGCGAKLQNINPDEIGYINSIDDEICKRCFDMKNYNKYTKVDLGNNEFMDIINKIPKNHLILYVCDLLTLNMELIKDINNIVDKNEYNE